MNERMLPSPFVGEEGLKIKEQLSELFSDSAVEQIASQYRSLQKLMAYFRCAMMEVETKFNVLNEECSLRFDRNPILDIRTRLKSFRSMKEKLEKKGLPMTVQNVEEHLSDVAGVRVVCSFPADVYLLSQSLLQQDDVVLIEKKDYIQNPKPNGYRSLHLIVQVPIFLAKEKRLMRVEIQLRTIAMDTWASLEHQLKYKKSFVFDRETEEELLDCAELSARLDAKMDGLRRKLGVDEE